MGCGEEGVLGCRVSSRVVSRVRVMLVSLVLLGVVLFRVIDSMVVSSGVLVLISGDMIMVLL